MADKITEGTILAIGLEYADVSADKIKTAYVKVPNPKNNLTEQEIKTVAQQLINGDGAILRDANGAPFDSETAIVTAYREYTKTIEYDIGVE